MAETTAIAVAVIAIAAGSALYLWNPDLTETMYDGGTLLFRVLILLTGLAALATGQLVVGAAILFVTVLYYWTEIHDEEVLGA